MLAGAVGLVVSSVLGVLMAYRFSQRPLVATICLLSGIIVPAIMLWIYRQGNRERGDQKSEVRGQIA